MPRLVILDSDEDSLSLSIDSDPHPRPPVPAEDLPPPQRIRLVPPHPARADDLFGPDSDTEQDPGDYTGPERNASFLDDSSDDGTEHPFFDRRLRRPVIPAAFLGAAGFNTLGGPFNLAYSLPVAPRQSFHSRYNTYIRHVLGHRQHYGLALAPGQSAKES